MYIPKHRGEPEVVWRVHYFESERGWGSERFHKDFLSESDAQESYNSLLPKEGPVPDYYIISRYMERITL